MTQTIERRLIDIMSDTPYMREKARLHFSHDQIGKSLAELKAMHENLMRLVPDPEEISAYTDIGMKIDVLRQTIKSRRQSFVKKAHENS